MKRSPLKRGTSQLKRSPLKRGTSQLKRTPMKRGSSTLKREPMKRVATPDPVTPDVRAEVARRSGGRCEARLTLHCMGEASHIHHRKLRRYGDHRPINLIHACLRCHTAIHAEPAWSYAHGFLLHEWDDPECVIASARPDGYPR